MKRLVLFILFCMFLLQCSADASYFSLLKHHPSKWMLKQISNDFEAFENTGISIEELEDFLSDRRPEEGFVRYKINKGVVYMDSKTVHPGLYDRADAIYKAFQKIASFYPVPDVDLIVSMHDACYDMEHHVPILSFAKDLHSQKVILIPDFEALIGHKFGKKFLREGEKKYPWEEKKEKCFWRGSSSGGIFRVDNWKKFARAKIVLMSFENPDFIDARLTALVQGAEGIKEMRKLLGDPVSPLDSLQYKYLIDIDGNSCAYSRYYWSLLSNSVIFKQVTDNIQWYYGGLKPYRHYIPVASDFENLIAQMEWAQRNDKECKRIAQRATDFILEEVNEEKIYLYLYAVLLKYADLQNE